MRWAEGKALNASCHPVWNARDRDEAVTIVEAAFGAHGENLMPPNGPVGADPSDSAFFASPTVRSWWTSSFVPHMFTHGVVGYVDDRLADANGWGTFDVARITCPVAVLHGGSDGLVPVANARHTAAIVPGATLRIVDGLGHVSILTKVVDVTSDLLANATVASGLSRT
jgi:pimeloyl-ACP methyl ester carboxylesterase